MGSGDADPGRDAASTGAAAGVREVVGHADGMDCDVWPAAVFASLPGAQVGQAVTWRYGAMG